MNKHLPVVYSWYPNASTEWKYRNHGTIDEVYSMNFPIYSNTSLEKLVSSVVSQGKYVLIDDVSGDYHVVELELSN